MKVLFKQIRFYGTKTASRTLNKTTCQTSEAMKQNRSNAQETIIQVTGGKWCIVPFPLDRHLSLFPLLSMVSIAAVMISPSFLFTCISLSAGCWWIWLRFRTHIAITNNWTHERTGVWSFSWKQYSEKTVAMVDRPHPISWRQMYTPNFVWWFWERPIDKRHEHGQCDEYWKAECYPLSAIRRQNKTKRVKKRNAYYRKHYVHSEVQWFAL